MRKKDCAIIQVLLSLVLILGSISLACSAEPAPAPPPTLPSMAPDLEIPTNYTTYTDETKFFSISYPSDWEPLVSYIADIDKAVKEVINDIQSGIPIERTSIIFVAGQPMTGGSYDPSVNIVVEPIPEGLSTLDQIVEAEIRGAEMVAQDRREFSRVKTTINGIEATILDHEATLPEIGKRHMLQMVTLVGETMWVVSCSSTCEDFATWEKDFHAIVRSLRISN